MRLFGYEIRRVRKGYNCLHPEFKTLTEFAFEIDGEEYYTFKNLLDMPQLRYKKVMEFIRESELSITSKDLIEIIDKSIEHLDNGEVSKSIIIQSAAKSLCTQFIETDTYYRLFSCVFFTLDEDLTDYDYDFNDVKIDKFKSQPEVSFFFNQPMRKYLIQPDISEKDLKTFLALTKANKEYLRGLKNQSITKSQTK